MMNKEQEDIELAKEVIEEQKYYQTIFEKFPKDKQIRILEMQRDMIRLVANSINQLIKRKKEE